MGKKIIAVVISVKIVKIVNNNNNKFWNLDLLDYNMEQDEYFKQFNFQN